MIKHYNAFLNKWNRVKDNIGDGAFGKVFMCEPKTEFKFDPECKGSNKHTLLGYDSFTIRKIPIPRSKNGDIRGTLIGNEIGDNCEREVHPSSLDREGMHLQEPKEFLCFAGASNWWQPTFSSAVIND